jgi:hypothetical protein
MARIIGAPTATPTPIPILVPELVPEPELAPEGSVGVLLGGGVIDTVRVTVTPLLPAPVLSCVTVFCPVCVAAALPPLVVAPVASAVVPAAGEVGKWPAMNCMLAPVL